MSGVRKELKLCEDKTVESSVDEPPEVELKELPPHLEYAFLEGDDKLPVIIAKDLKDEKWQLFSREDYEPSVQSQRRVNPKIYDVIKKEVEKLLDAGLIYPISDSPWVKPDFVKLPCGKVWEVYSSRECRTAERINSLKMLNITFQGRPLLFKNYADQVIRRCVSGARSFRHSQSLHVDPLGDYYGAQLPQERSLTQDSIGPPSTRMPTTLSPVVTFVNVKERLRNVMRCHKTPSKFAKSLTSGALILWGRSRLQEGTSTYSWLLTTCQNGLKQSCSTPMMPSCL
ncbi:hypothetical protein Tco_1193578 [Tanacetum coccineum]